MLTWHQRPTEVAHLLNPAFCAVILREAIRGFAEENPAGMPYAVVFLVLPIILHRATRAALPNSIATKMHPWIEENQQFHVGFATRCAAIVDYTREGLLYASGKQLFAFTNDARLLYQRRRVKLPAWPDDSEPVACLERARFLGRWLARAGDTATIFAMWGIRP